MRAVPAGELGVLDRSAAWIGRPRS